MQDQLTYSYTDVDGVPYAYVPYTQDGLVSVHVLGSQDPVSGKSNVLGSAFQSYDRNHRPVTLCDKHGQFFTIRGHAAERHMVASIVLWSV